MRRCSKSCSFNFLVIICSMLLAKDLPELCSPSIITCNNSALSLLSYVYRKRTLVASAHNGASVAIKLSTLRRSGALSTISLIITGRFFVAIGRLLISNFAVILLYFLEFYSKHTLIRGIRCLRKPLYHRLPNAYIHRYF